MGKSGPKWVKNRVFFIFFGKFCHDFFLEIAKYEMSYDSLFSSANSVSMKTVVAQVIAQNTLGQLDYKIL